MDTKDFLASALDEAPLAAPKGGWEAHNKQYHKGKMPDPEHCSFLRNQMQGGAGGGQGENAPQKPIGASEGEIEEVDVIEEGEASGGAEGASGALTTPEEDAAYKDAVERGDLKTVERMLRETAAKAMPNTKVVDRKGLPLIVYHGTVSRTPVTTFSEKPIYAFHREGLASQYTHPRADLWVSPSQTGRVMPMFMNLENPLVVDANKRLWRNIQVDWSPTPVTTEDIVDYAKKNGYDGVIVRRVRDNMFDDDRTAGDEYIAFSSSQVKSLGSDYEKQHIGWGNHGDKIKNLFGATRDNEGNVIPLSQRFDRNNADLRYSMGEEDAPQGWTRKAKALAQRAARALRNFLPGIKVEFAEGPHSPSAEDFNGDKRLSVADIARLSYQFNGETVSLKNFANVFQTAIKQKDRTIEDAERIANEYLDAIEESPEQYVPQLVPEKMSHMRYLFTSKGELYDPSNLQHVGAENDIPRQIYSVYSDALGEEKFGRMRELLKKGKGLAPEEKTELMELEAEANGSRVMQRALAESAERVNAERVANVKNLLQYFSGNDDYTATEKALILNGAMRYGLEEKMTGNGLEQRMVSLSDSNEVQVGVTPGDQTARLAEHLRRGETYKQAFLAAAKEIREAKSAKRGVPPDFTGWKVYKKDASEEAAVELNQAVAGTGWCTGGAVSTAQAHRSGGDFHVYFRNGEPLIALRTNNGRLAEAPRGAHPGQFCTGEEEEIAEEYIRAGNGIVAGKAYLDDRADIRKVQSGQLTWQDALRIPKERRYANGEYGGDTKAWPEPMRKAIEKVIADHDEERKAAGWLTLEEAYEQPEKVKVIIGRAVLGWDPKRDMSFPNLEEVIGDLRLHSGRQYEFPRLKRIGGYANFPEGASAPMLESIGGKADIHKGASAPALKSIGGGAVLEGGASAPALTSIGDYAELHKGVSAPALKSIGGNAFLYEGVSAPALTSIGGNATFYAGASAPALKSIGGNATFYEGASAPVLASIGGDVELLEDASPPALKSIGGDACLFAGASAPALTSIGGNAVLYKGASAPVLASIGGGATLYAGASAPALTSIGGNAVLHVGASAPVLASIGGNAELHVGASAPVLASIGGGARLYEGASAPALTSVGGNASLSLGVSAPALKSIGGNAFLFEGVSAPNLERVGGEVTSYGNVHAPKLKMDHDTRELRGEGGSVVGEYDRRTNKVTLYPGATAETVVHELAGHGAYQYAEQLAAKGDDRLLRKLNEIADGAPRELKDSISGRYNNASEAIRREEAWTHLFAKRGAEALRKAQKTRKGRSWAGRMMSAARDVVRGIGSRVGLNRIDLSQMENMSAPEALDWLAKQMAKGKTLGRVRPSAQAKAVVQDSAVAESPLARYIPMMLQGRRCPPSLTPLV